MRVPIVYRKCGSPEVSQPYGSSRPVIGIAFLPFTRKLTYSTDLSPSREVASCVAIQKLPKTLGNTNVYYHVHKSSPLVPILSQMNPVHTSPPIYLRSTQILLSHLSLGLPIGLFRSGFLTKILYTFLFSRMRTKRPAHVILLDFIILIILEEEKLRKL
jgi:hypothetical protein